MKKSAHQIWKEAKELGLNDEEFKKYLKDNGIVVPKESIVKPMLAVRAGIK